MGSGSSSSLEPPGRRRTKIRSKLGCEAFKRSPRARPEDPRLKLFAGLKEDVDGRDKPGHDGLYLWTLKMRAIKPIERLVPVSYTHYCASTPGLSTWWSTTVLKGMLVLRWVSRLDAFSGYPVRT